MLLKKTTKREKLTAEAKGLPIKVPLAILLCLALPVRSSADWSVHSTRDELYDYTVTIAANGSLGTGLSINGVFVRCRGTKLSAFVSVPENVLGSGNRQVLYRIDQDTLVKEEWTIDPTSAAAFAPHPERFARDLMRGQSGVIALKDATHKEHRITSDLTGSRSAIAKSLLACSISPTREVPKAPHSVDEPELGALDPQMRSLDNLLGSVLSEFAKELKGMNHPAPGNKDELDLGELQALLDKAPKEGPKSRAQSTKDALDSLDGFFAEEEKTFLHHNIGLEGGLTVSEIDALRQEVHKCWRPPTGAANPDDLIVELRIFLGEDGSLIRSPRIERYGISTFRKNSFTMAAEEAARRAVVMCAPYDFLPIDKYEQWKEVTITFDPATMIGY